MKKILLLLSTFVLLTLCLSCSDDKNSGNTNFNGTFSGKKVVVISDIHMNDQRAARGGWSWINERRGALIDFLHHVATKNHEYGTLVVAGDLFDEWVAPMDESPFQNLAGEDVRTESEYFQVLVRDNKDIIDAFREVRNAGIELVYVPGNHDLTCTKEDFDTYLPGLFTQARDAFGLGAYTPNGMPEVVIEHGHRYDYNNMPNPISTPGGYYPIGYVASKYGCTINLNNANIVQATPNDGPSLFNSLPAMENNMAIMAEYNKFIEKNGLTDWPTYNIFCNEMQKIKLDADSAAHLYKDTTSPGFIEEFNHFAADAAWAVIMIAKSPRNFIELLEILNTKVVFPEPYKESYLFKDIIPYFRKPELFQNLWTNENWARLQQTNNVSVQLPFAMSILAGGIDDILDAMAPTEYFNNPASNKRIVVFGHTHKGIISAHENTRKAKSLYANSGCWIDDKFGDPAQGVTFQTYVVIDRQKNTYTVTLNEWGKDKHLAEDTITLE